MLNVIGGYKVTQFNGKVTGHIWFKVNRTLFTIPIRTIETWLNSFDEAQQIIEWYKELLKENRI